MRGVPVDLGRLMAQQEKNITVGNTNTNARGDQLGRAGRVIKGADELAREHYNRNNPNAVKKTTLKVDDTPFDMDEKLKAAHAAAASADLDDWEEPVSTAATEEAVDIVKAAEEAVSKETEETVKEEDD